MKLGIAIVGIILAMVACIVTWVSITSVSGLPSELRQVPREDTCGPRSLWYAAERTGVPLSSVQLDSHFSDGTSRGTTLAELATAAEQFGLNVQSGSFNWSQLIEHDGTAVLFVENDHFVAVDPREQKVCEATNKGAIRVYDVKRAAGIWLSQAELGAIWGGDALLLSPRRRSNVHGPILAREFCLQDVGLLHDPLKVHYRFPIRNDGDEVLTLKVIGTSCTCTKATLTRETLDTREEGFIDVDFDLMTTEGRFAGLVEVETNDPHQRYATFHLLGAVYRTKLLSTQIVMFGQVDPGKKTSNAIAALDPGDGRLRIDFVESQLVVPVADSKSQPELRVAIRPYGELEPSLRGIHNLTYFDSLVELEVSTPADCAPGDFEFNCLFSTNQEIAPSLNVVVQGSVLPDLFAEPKALILKLPDDGHVINTQVTIRSRSGTEIGNLRSTMDGGLSLISDTCELDADSVTLKLQVGTPEAITTGWNDGSLLCTARDGRTVTIPMLVSGKKISP